MKWKVVVSLFAVLSFFGAKAQAQDVPKVDVFAGYSYFRANPAASGVDSFSLNGGSAAVAYNATSWLSGVADFGGYTSNNILGTHAGGTLSTYLFGPRISVRRFDRVTPYGQVLFGAAHIGSNIFGVASSTNAFAMSVGGGFDVNVSHHFAVRPAQVDYLLTRFDEATNSARSQNNLRVSTGVVFRF
jgi:hypothetical protein